jgi:hypothetical protein
MMTAAFGEERYASTEAALARDHMLVRDDAARMREESFLNCKKC